MIRKHLNLLWLYLLISSFGAVQAQNLKKDLDISLSPSFKISKNKEHLAMVALSGESFVALESRPGRISRGFDLIRYDANFKEQARSTIELRKEDKDQHYSNLFFLKGSLYLVLVTEDKSSLQRSLMLQQINTESLKREGPATMLSKLTTMPGMGVQNGFFRYQFSSDSSKLLIVQSDESRRNEFIDYELTVLDCDDDFNPLWTRKIKSEQKDHLEDLEKFALSKEGIAYLLFLEFEGTRKYKSRGEPNYSYELRAYKNPDYEPFRYPIKLKDEFITEMQIGINQNSNLVCTGFYSSVGTTSVKGCYYLLFDSKQQKIVKESKKEFSLDFLTANLSERKTKKTIRKKEKGKDVELEHYELGEIILDENGGVIQVAERYYVTQYSYQDMNGMFVTTYIYNYDDIIVASISPEGEFNWIRKIRKSQSSTNSPSPYASYQVHLVNNNMYFFHNGNAANLLIGEKEGTKSWSMGKKGVSIITEINQEGYLRKDVFSDVPAHRSIPIIQRGIQLQNDAILFYGEYKRDSRYIKVQVKGE